ncbi:hypothetical protein ABZ547_08240 [Streptomyces sparsogenes]|uniref:hypothetical protein n=1 Tax=Streptomyces sparsogenes TaxID=67365 RepID=UPI0033D6FD88
MTRDQLLAEARKARRAFEASGSDEDYTAAQQAIQVAREAGIGLAEIGRDQ